MEVDEKRDMEPIVILMVEDNPDHVLIIKRALKGSNLINQVRVVSDGQQAMDYLYRQGEYRDARTAPRPGLILLDLKLPKVDGFEVLKRIKGAPELKSIPVVVLTSSEQEVDMAKSYLEGANSYVVKPLEFNRFVEVIAKLKLYWVVVNSLPQGNAERRGSPS